MPDLVAVVRGWSIVNSFYALYSKKFYEVLTVPWTVLVLQCDVES